MNLCYSPSLDADIRAERLERLLVSGNLDDPELDRRARRLDHLFRDCARTCPAPLWAPGLRLDREWRTVTETFLPWAEIAPAFRSLISRSLRYPLPSDPLAPFPSWPDFLDRFASFTATANPAPLFRRLQGDGAFRRRWLFALFLPGAHGGGFDRYPVQAEYLREWLVRRRARSAPNISCLDAACGTGEGTWDLAGHLSDGGFRPDEVTLRGSSLDPLELFAAAHAAFPHDPSRERNYRLRTHPLVTAGFTERMCFVAEDLAAPDIAPEKHDLILCNGLLGGPLLHEPAAMARVVGGLVRRLRPGGVLLAADRFHEGWRKLVSKGRREAVLTGCGMRLLEIGEGIGGEFPC